MPVPIWTGKGAPKGNRIEQFFQTGSLVTYAYIKFWVLRCSEATSKWSNCKHANRVYLVGFVLNIFVNSECLVIGVRGSRTRYLIPGRDGMGAGLGRRVLPSPSSSPSPPMGIKRAKISKKLRCYQKPKLK